ncbi:MAG: prepilin-type N-terminal cleavage/methylation domain-containing protein [Phycisphaerales bacterium]|nr:prepilin-type N-terminal cleavage/methylation domain-containing protein [Phycisphaerales bacterium]
MLTQSTRAGSAIHAAVTAAAWLCFLFLLLTGILKAVDLNAFLLTLSSWQTVPKWLVALVGPAVPFIEIVLAGLWIIGIGHRRVALGAAMLVLATTFAFIFEYAHNPEASCGCFGKWSIRAASLEGPAAKALVNGGMIFVWVAYAVAPKAQTYRARAARRVPAAGFTLVELLISILVVAVLAGLSLTALLHGRESARAARLRADLRTHCQVFNTYANDAKAVFPYITSPREDRTYLTVAGLPAPIAVTYFQSREVWHLALAESYYSTTFTSALFHPPASPQTGPGGERLLSGYLYPCCFIALPGYWDPMQRLGAPALRGPTNVAMVQFPSQKAMIVPRWIRGDDGAPVQVSSLLACDLGFVDGSVARLEKFEHGAGLFGHGGSRMDLSGDNFPGMHTVRGVAGRDKLTRR